jgi:hypothetical protein
MSYPATCGVKRVMTWSFGSTSGRRAAASQLHVACARRSGAVFAIDADDEFSRLRAAAAAAYEQVQERIDDALADVDLPELPGVPQAVLDAGRELPILPTRRLIGSMRDRETIDSELRLLAAVRWSIREHGGEPSSRQVDERLAHRAAVPVRGAAVGT